MISGQAADVSTGRCASCGVTIPTDELECIECEDAASWTYPPALRLAIVALVERPDATDDDVAEHLLTVGSRDGSESYRLAASVSAYYRLAVARRARHLLSTNPARGRSLHQALS